MERFVEVIAGLLCIQNNGFEAAVQWVRKWIVDREMNAAGAIRSSRLVATPAVAISDSLRP